MGLSNRKPAAVSNQQSELAMVLMTGVHSAGKSTLLNVLKYGKNAPPLWHDSFEFIRKVNNTSIIVLGEGGRSSARLRQHMYYKRVSGIIFVVDSSDDEAIIDAHDSLLEMFNSVELRNKFFLIYANKRDLPNAIPMDEIQEKLGLNKLDKAIQWHLQPASAILDEGIQEGFTWLVNAVVKPVEENTPINESVDDLMTVKRLATKIWSGINMKSLYKRMIA